jgi:hypothetical protein
VHDRERRVDRGQRLRARRGDEREHAVVVGEAHLALRRVHVHVQPVGRHREPHHRRGEASVREQVAVGVPQRLRQRGAHHPATVDEEHLALARGARMLREPEQCGHGVASALRRGFQQLLRVPRAPHLCGALAVR